MTFDTRYGWLVTGITFFSFAVSTGISKCFSVFYMELVDLFHSSATATGWLIGAHHFLRLCLGPLASILCKKYSTKQVIICGGFLLFVGYAFCGQITSIIWMYATFSILAGIGNCFIFGPFTVLLGCYFENGRKGLAYAVAYSGMGFGIFVVPIAYSYLRTYFGFGDTMLLLGGVAFNIVPLGILCTEPMRRKQIHSLVCKQPIIAQQQDSDAVGILSKDSMDLQVQPHKHGFQEESLSTSAEQQNKKFQLRVSFDCSIFKNINVILVLSLTLLNSIAFSSFNTFCGAVVQSNGLTEKETSYLVSLSGITNIIGSIVFGLLSDFSHFRSKSVRLYCLSLTLFAIVNIAFPFLKTFLSHCIAFGLWGFFAVGNTIKNVVLCDNVTRVQLPDAIGASLVTMGIGFAAGPFVTGIFVDVCGSYVYPFIVPGGILAIISTLVFIADVVRD